MHSYFTLRQSRSMKDMLHPTHPPAHRDAHARRLQNAGEARRGELATLISVEDVRAAEPCQGDDATSRLMQLRFVASESAFDYFRATRAYLEAYGKPTAFYSDK